MTLWTARVAPAKPGRRARCARAWQPGGVVLGLVLDMMLGKVPGPLTPLLSVRPRVLWLAWLAGLLGALAACGGGTESPAAEPLPTSAQLQATGRELDLGIEGPGAFILLHPQTGERRFSRWGRFQLDSAGRLVNAEGWRVAGLPPDAAGTAAASGSAGALPALPIVMAGQATTGVYGQWNLSSQSQSVAGLPFDITDARTYNYTNSLPVVRKNTLAAGALTFAFRRLDTLADAAPPGMQLLWEVRLFLNGEPLLSQPVWSLAFPSEGGQVPDGRLTVSLPVETAQGQVTTDTQPLLLDLSPTKVSAGAFGPLHLATDGYRDGALSSLVVDGQGRVRLGYSNGQQRDGGQLLLARFGGTDRLVNEGTLWACEAACAGPSIGVPGAEGFSPVRARMLNRDH